MHVKLPQFDKLALFLVMLSASACAFEEAQGEGSVASESDTPIVADAVADRGGLACGPVLRLDQNGQLFVDEYLCPLPNPPTPDPELNRSPEERSEWVTAETPSDLPR